MDTNNMEMPCLCDCGNWFDLNDGYASEVRTQGSSMKIVICGECYEREGELQGIENEIDELEIQIEEYKDNISDAESNIEYWTKEQSKTEDKLDDLRGQLKKLQ